MIEVLTSWSFILGVMSALVVVIAVVIAIEIKEKIRWDKNQSVFKTPIPYNRRYDYVRKFPKKITKK